MKNLHVQLSDDSWSVIESACRIFTTRRLLENVINYLRLKGITKKGNSTSDIIVSIALGDYKKVDKLIKERNNCGNIEN